MLHRSLDLYVFDIVPEPISNSIVDDTYVVNNLSRVVNDDHKVNMKPALDDLVKASNSINGEVSEYLVQLVFCYESDIVQVGNHFVCRLSVQENVDRSPAIQWRVIHGEGILWHLETMSKDLLKSHVRDE